MKKLCSFLIIIFCAATSSIFAQSNATADYKTAIGVKLFDGGGLTVKHFVTDKAAIEGIAYFWNRGTRITGLYEIHNNLEGVEGLKWYYGGGGHIGIYPVKYGNGTFLGIDGVLGLDYKINTLPLNLSLDWQPSFEFGTDRGFNGSWGGLAVRYTF